MNQPRSMPKKNQSFRPLLFAPPQGPDALPDTVRPRPAPTVTRSVNDSHIRLRAQCVVPSRAADIELNDARELLDELCEEQLMMSIDLARLEESLAAAPWDPSARAALRTLEAQLGELGAVRDALASVHVAAVDPRLLRVFVPDAPATEYLRGVYGWMHAVVRAFEHLAGSLRLQPDWALLRSRLEEAKNFHFDELHEPIRADLLALMILADGGSLGVGGPAIEALRCALERLLAAAVTLEAHLDERFG